MAYGTITDIRDLGYIPDEDLDALNTERPTRIPQLFAAVSGWMDSYLRPRHKLPFATAPAELIDACVAIVVWRLYITRGLPSLAAPNADPVVTEIKAAFDRAMDWLKAIRKGEAFLAYDGDSSPDNDEEGSSLGSAANPIVYELTGGGYGGVSCGSICGGCGGCGC